MEKSLTELEHVPRPVAGRREWGREEMWGERAEVDTSFLSKYEEGFDSYLYMQTNEKKG